MLRGPLKQQDFQFVREISRNAHGGVHVARHRASGMMVAIKERRVSELGHGRDLMTEYNILSRIDHPCIVSCLGYYWGDESRRALFLVLELASAGDLHADLRQRRAGRRHLEGALMWRLFGEICAGLAHLHANGIVHRDVKTMNVLLFFDGGELRAKLGDLGVSRVMQEEEHLMSTIIGTPLYLSPELCQRRSYSHKTDMWSLGVVLYEMASLHHPFEGRSVVELSRAIVAGRYPPLAGSCTDGAIAGRLVAALLRPVPRERPEAVAVLRWMTQHGVASARTTAAGPVSPALTSLASPPSPSRSQRRPRRRASGPFPARIGTGAARESPAPAKGPPLPAHGRALPHLGASMAKAGAVAFEESQTPGSASHRIPGLVPANELGNNPPARRSTPAGATVARGLSTRPHSLIAQGTGRVRIVRVRRRYGVLPAAEDAAVASDDSEATLPGPGDEDAAQRARARALDKASDLPRRPHSAVPSTTRSRLVVIAPPTSIAKRVEALRQASDARRRERDRNFVPFQGGSTAEHRRREGTPPPQPPQPPQPPRRGTADIDPALSREGQAHDVCERTPSWRAQTARDRRWLARRDEHRRRAAEAHVEGAFVRRSGRWDRDALP